MAIGLVIPALAGRLTWKWARGDYRAGRHPHGFSTHRHLQRETRHNHGSERSPRGSFAIGVLHGLAGAGAVIVLLIAALPGRIEAAAAMVIFARCR